MSIVESATLCYNLIGQTVSEKIASGDIEASDATAVANSICDAFKQAANEAGENDFPEKFTPLVEGRLGEDGVNAFATLYSVMGGAVIEMFKAGKISSAEEANANANAICDAFKTSANAEGEFAEVFQSQIQDYM